MEAPNDGQDPAYVRGAREEIEGTSREDHKFGTGHETIEQRVNKRLGLCQSNKRSCVNYFFPVMTHLNLKSETIKVAPSYFNDPSVLFLYGTRGVERLAKSWRSCLAFCHGPGHCPLSLL